MTLRSRVALVFVCAATLAPSVAFAQRASPANPGQNPVYVFSDDGVLGNGLDGTVPVLRVRPDAGRVTLIRPRTTFVPEMLKSVEHI